MFKTHVFILAVVFEVENGPKHRLHDHFVKYPIGNICSEDVLEKDKGETVPSPDPTSLCFHSTFIFQINIYILLIIDCESKDLVVSEDKDVVMRG